jgi:hypothetical protein
MEDVQNWEEKLNVDLIGIGFLMEHIVRTRRPLAN